MRPAIVWFRRDLRLQDNPALHAAVKRGGAVVPVFVLDEGMAGQRKSGAASRWWLRRSLAELDASVRERGGRLVLAKGDARAVLRRLVEEVGATAVYWNRCYEPAAVTRDAKIETEFSAGGLDVRTFNGSLLHEPHEVANKQGRPFQVYSPFWRTCLTRPVAPPVKLGAGERWRVPEVWPRSQTLAELELDGAANADVTWGERWAPGEATAAKRLREFGGRRMDEYDDARDVPGCEGTSRLSAALHFGELSPRQVWAAVKARARESGVFPPSRGAQVFLGQIGWREFGYHLLYHFPNTAGAPKREEFARFPWAEDPGGEKLAAWQKGETGYPIVDAGMRQLAQTGWMHNRVRMIVASFLVKHLRLPWTAGAAWFWEMLVDADLANNTLGWQWSAGCGADAAPYFRIFSPVLQGQKFDPRGAYVRRWVPELAQVPDSVVHAPWTAAEAVLADAGVVLGKHYPRPLVDHATARREALEALKQMNQMRGLSPERQEKAGGNMEVGDGR